MLTNRASTQRGRVVLVVESDPEVAQILEVNLRHANLEFISAGDGAEALIKAHTERPDIILIDDVLPDLEAGEICRQLKQSPLTSHIPVIVVGAESQSKKRTAKGAGEADNYITKPFDPKEVVALVKTCLKRTERAENMSPLTGLPNEIQVNNEITGLIEQNKTFAAMYLDLDDLKIFNKVYGFPQGDRAIRLLAEILCEAVRLFGNPDDMVGHLGGDDFVIVTTIQKARALCQRIIADFDGRVRTLYKREDLQRGYIEYEGRLGQKEQCPIMSLRAAVVSNERRTFRHHLEVSEAAAEQIEYLRRFPGSNCYFDRRESGTEPELSLVYGGVPYAQREELRTAQGVLAWVAFLTRELDMSITSTRGCLEIIELMPAEGLTAQQRNTLATIRENVSQLVRIVEELTHLTRGERITGSAVLDEVDFGNTLDWIMEQAKGLAEQRRIEVDIERAEGISRLVVDASSLAQGLFYALRSEIKSSAPGDRVHIRVSETGKGFITVELINPNRYTPPWELAMLFQGQLEGMFANGQRNDLYLAKVLLQGLGGKLSIESEKGKGTTLTLSLPVRWQSSRQEINALLSAAETSKKEAREQLEDIGRLLSSTEKRVPQAVKESLQGLGYKIQELLVLCNRSLFLADDLGGRLETQQDQVLRQEVAQLAALEAILIISREIARSMRVRFLFDVDSAQRVAKYALAIANEFRLSRSERQTLHYAALLKDLALVSSPDDLVERKAVSTIDKAIALRERFNLVWKALSPIDFLAPALAFVAHRYERYDGQGYPSGVRGSSTPLGARILAVADTFDAMTSGLRPQGTIALKTAVERLVADSGQRFDPDVVDAFVRAWRKKEFQVTSIRS